MSTTSNATNQSLDSLFTAFQSRGRSGQLPWYAIQVRSRSEFQAFQELSLRGFESFLPTRRVRHRWTDRFKELDVPLFPGYLFTRFEMENRFRILNLRSVAYILGSGSSPTPVGDAEIRSIQALVESKVMLVPWPFLQAGHRVMIGCGPLAGVEGTVVRTEDGKPRVVVSVTLLQRSVAAEIDRSWISSAR